MSLASRIASNSATVSTYACLKFENICTYAMPQKPMPMRHNMAPMRPAQSGPTGAYIEEGSGQIKAAEAEGP